jgi:ribonuclease P protein component
LTQIGLSAKERIKSKKLFEILFSTGTFIHTSAGKLKAVFCLIEDSPIKGIKAAFVISKRCGNAVWRNRLRRLLKESYRTNKELIVCKKDKLLLIAFLSGNLNEKNADNIRLEDVITEMKELMKKINGKISDA